MNEQIQALVKRANEELAEGGESFIEKFAELIVRECAKIAYAGIGADQLDEYDRGWQNGRNLASELIKEHFGVEE